MIKRSIVVTASRVPARYTQRHTFASYSGHCQQILDESSATLPDIEKVKEKETPQAIKENLYENSKAALRPRANATSALYSGQLVVKSGFKRSSLRLSDFPDADHEQDRVLKHLYLQIEDKRGIGDIFACLETCRKIKRRLQKLHVEEGRANVAPIFVYRTLLTKLTLAGSYNFARQIVDDMEAAGHAIDLSILNSLLQAAVLNGDEENINAVLTRIAELRDEGDHRPAAGISEEKYDGQIISAEWSRNWNAITYQHLFQRCRLAHNAEYALALIASASHRGQESAEGNSFLSTILSQTCVANIVAVLGHVREARLTVDLIQWLDNGITPRRINAQTWMIVLQICADQLYHPGIIIAWEKAVVIGLLTPDEGVIISALNAASRAGDTQFIEGILSFYQTRLAMTHGPLREWHLLPKFQSQCFNEDFEGAFRTATGLARLSGAGLRADKLLATKAILALVPDALDKAYEAFIKVGRDPSLEGGVCLAILNNLLKAANAQDRADLVLKIYRSRNLVRNEQAPADVELPINRRLLRGEDERDLLIEEDDNLNRNVEDEAVKAKHTLNPDVFTFNELFYCALKLKDIKMSEIIRRQLNKAGVKGNERTYELATRIELLKSDYENVFTLLEECKKRLMIPTGWMYTHIARRCIEEQDRRWIELGKEMLENQYPLPAELLSLMIKGGHYSPERESGKEEGERGGNIYSSR